MSDALLQAVLDGVQIFDLGRTLSIGMPQSPNHPAFWHTLPRRHGDMVRSDGGSAANDMISMGTHVGTHIDALAHVSQDGKLFGGADAYAAGIGGRYRELGVHTIAPMMRRGVLLDIPAAINAPDGACAAGYEITIPDLRAAEDLAEATINAGDVVLIRSGWGRQFDRGPAAYAGKDTGVPGIGPDAARYLADKGIHAAGADTIAFERLAPSAGHGLLPVHRIMLVESGIYLLEAMDLEELSETRTYEFTFLLAPLKIFGATGSPVRPLAVVSNNSANDNNPTNDGSPTSKGRR